MTVPQPPGPILPVAPAPLNPPVHYLSFIAPVTEATMQRLLDAVVAEINAGAKTVYLLLSTPGGSVRDGMALYNILRGLPCQVVTHNAANVDSIGNVLFLAGARRLCAPNATFMFHGVGFDVPQGTRLEQKNTKELMDNLTAETLRMAGVINARATFPNQAEVDQLFLEASTKDAAYAKSRGIVHEIVDVQIPVGARFRQLVF